MFFPFSPEQISNLMNQVKEATKNLTEMEKVKKLIEQEKTEAQATLEVTEGWSPGRREGFPSGNADDLYSSINSSSTPWHLLKWLLHGGTVPNAQCNNPRKLLPHFTKEEIEAKRTG